MQPTLFLRSAAVVTLLLGAGHMIGRPWTPAHDPQAVAVVETMKSHRIHIAGFDRTLMDFYQGFGWMVGIYLLGQAVLLWMFVGLAGSEPTRVRRIAAVFFIVNALQTIIAAEYLFTVPLVMSGIVALCLAAAVLIPSNTLTPASVGPDRAPQV